MSAAFRWCGAVVVPLILATGAVLVSFQLHRTNPSLSALWEVSAVLVVLAGVALGHLCLRSDRHYVERRLALGYIATMLLLTLTYFVGLHSKVFGWVL